MTDRRLTVSVDADLCEGHGMCVQVAPDVFDLGDDDLAVCDAHPPAATEESVRGAVGACPRQAISMTAEPG
ncbi:ferredoxin [Gordonia sp. CPCC 206044]|uniref:ferredoxin n=1 Tax=Gordonia sp. CPCC 206044 TaxID=3140793 RepID=UPI003AF396A4